MHSPSLQLNRTNSDGATLHSPVGRRSSRTSTGRDSGLVVKAERDDYARRGLLLRSKENIDIKIPAARPLPEMPQPIPVVHSSSFLVESSRKELGFEDETSSAPPSSSYDSPDPFTGNALQWALKRADRALKDIETAPPELAVEALRVANSPAGRLLGAAAKETAKVTMVVGQEVVKAGLPMAKTAASAALSVAIDVLKKSTSDSSGSGGGRKAAPPASQASLPEGDRGERRGEEARGRERERQGANSHQ